jgi:protein gp37
MLFVGDLGDIFSEDVPFDYLKAELIDVATSVKGRRHVWMLLTKQPQRMAAFARWLADEHGIARLPENIWAGTSITTQATTTRIRHLLDVPAAMRYVSLEPQIGAVDLHSAFYVGPEGGWEWEGARRQMVHLVIQGGESDQGKYRGRPFDIAWARTMRDECRRAEVAYHLKQLGSRPFDSFYRSGVADQAIHLRDRHGEDWSVWPEDLKVRQMPTMEAAHATD